MYLTYSYNFYKSKEDSILGLKHKDKWYIASVQTIPEAHTLIMSLYDNGYSLNITDFNQSPVYILDLDELTQEQYTLIHSKAFQDQVKNYFNLDFIEVRHSSSKSNLKAKMFLFKNWNRCFQLDNNNVPVNIDYTYSQARKEFQELTGIVPDYKMDSYSQITFGAKILDLPLPTHNITHTHCSQPKKLDCTNYSRTKNQDIKVPINLLDYTTLYGKKILIMPRLEWNYKFYNKMSDSMKKIQIKKGHRYNSSFRLINTVVFNCYLSNALYNTHYTLKDCDEKVKQVIFNSFEEPCSFWKESGSDIIKTTYKVFNDFKEKLEHSDIVTLYKDTCSKLKVRPSFTYKPKEISYMSFFKMLVPHLNTISDRYDRMKFLYETVNHDRLMFKKMKMCYNKLKNELIPCIDNTAKFRVSKYEYIVEEFNLTQVPVQINTRTEQLFCIKKHIPYKKVKEFFNRVLDTLTDTVEQSFNKLSELSEGCFRSITNTLLSPSLLLLSRWLHIRNIINNEELGLDDFRYLIYQFNNN